MNILLWIILAFSFNAFGFLLLSPERYDRLAQNHLPRYVSRALEIISILLLGLLIIDELGQLLAEWGLALILFEWTRRIISLAGVKHLIYLANLGLAVMAGYQAFVEMHQKTPEQQRRRSGLSIALIVLGGSLLITSCQGFVWRESWFSDNFLDWSGIGTLLATMCMGILPIFVYCWAAHRANKCFGDKESLWTFKTFIIIAFLSFSQTMVTKVLAILLVWRAARRRLRRKACNDGVPLDFGLPVLTRNLETTGLRRFNAMALAMLCVPFLALWAIQVSPFPHTTTSYPKGITLSAIFCCAIGVFVVVDLLADYYWNWLRTLSIPLANLLVFGPFFIFPSWIVPPNPDAEPSLVAYFYMLDNHLIPIIATIFFNYALCVFVVWSFVVLLDKQKLQKTSSQRFQSRWMSAILRLQPVLAVVWPALFFSSVILCLIYSGTEWLASLLQQHPPWSTCIFASLSATALSRVSLKSRSEPSSPLFEPVVAWLRQHWLLTPMCLLVSTGTGWLMLDVGYLAAPQVKPYFVEKWSTKLFEKDKTHRVAGSNSDNIKWVDMRPLLLDSGHIVVGWQHSHMASNMVCLNPGDGTIRWEQEGIAGSHGTSQLRSYGFSVFSQLSPGRIVSILRGKVEVLDAKDGEVITKWEVPIEQERCEGYWGIKVFKGIGFVIRKEGEPLVIFDENAHMLPSPGQCDSFRMCTAGEKPTIICNSHFLIWRPGKWHRIELEEQLGKSLEIWHDRLISTGEGWVRCFDLRSGKILWQRNLVDFAKPEEKVNSLYIARTQVAAKGGYLFLDCAKPSGKRDVSLVEARWVQDLMCIEMETGQTLWTVPIGHARGPDSGEVSVEEGVVIVKEMLFIQDRIFSLGLMNMYVRLKVIDLESGEVLRYLPGAFCTRAIGRFSRQNMEILGSAVLYSDIGVKEQLTVYDIKTGRRVFRHWFAMIPTTLDESGAFKAMQKAVFGDIVIDGNNWYWLGISGSVYAAQMPKDATIPLGMLRDRQADQVLSK